MLSEKFGTLDTELSTVSYRFFKKFLKLLLNSTHFLSTISISSFVGFLFKIDSSYTFL